MAKAIIKKFRFESSSSDKVYETLLYEDGTTSCNCPGWTRHVDIKGRRSCKHTKQVEGSYEAKHAMNRPAHVDPNPTIAPETLRAAPPSTPKAPAMEEAARRWGMPVREHGQPGIPPTPPPPPKGPFPGVMLAERWEPSTVLWPEVWAEPKLDGMRILIVRRGDDVRAFARSGKEDPYTENLGHILKQLPQGGDFAIDGELYADEGWGRTMTMAKKRTVAPAERLALRVRAFDMLDLAGLAKHGRDKRPLRERRAELERLVRGLSHIVPVPYRVFPVGSTRRAGEQDGIDEFYREALDQGYEGLILKNPVGGYQPNYRSPGWLKMKPVATGDGVIEGFEEGKGKHEGRLGAVRVRFEGELVDVGGGYTDAEREWIWANRPALIGGMLEFIYQKDTVAVARFPRFKRFRWDRERDVTLAASWTKYQGLPRTARED